MVSLFDFAGDPAQNQIGLVKGQQVGVIDKDSGGWWWGQNAKGEKGYFPDAFVGPLDPGATVDAVAAGTKAPAVASGLQTVVVKYFELPVEKLQTKVSVNISGKSLQPTDAIIIASLMSMVNTPLTDLNLAENYIGKEGAIVIAKALPR